MSSKVRIALKRRGVRELLKSPEMQAVISEHAERIAGRAGSGYKYDTKAGRKRCNARIKPKTHEAYKDNLKNNTLLKAVSE